MSSGCPTASHTGEERPRSIKSGLQNNCCCAGLLFSNTHVAGPLEILSSSFITDHLKTREADLPGLEETPRPTERRQPYSFLLPLHINQRRCLTVSACEVVVSDEFQSVSNLLHTHDHVTLGVWIYKRVQRAGGRLLKTKTFVRCWRKQ